MNSPSPGLYSLQGRGEAWNSKGFSLSDLPNT
jgi:hypothetical protein